jgi:hypothetical protein
MYNQGQGGSYSNQMPNNGNSKYASASSSNYPPTSQYLPPSVPMNEKSDYQVMPQGHNNNYQGNHGNQYNNQNNQQQQQQQQQNNNYAQYENNPQVQQPQVLQTTIPGSNQPNYNNAPGQQQREPLYDVPSYPTTRQPSAGAPPAYNNGQSNMPSAFQPNTSQNSAYPPNASYSAQLQFVQAQPQGTQAP